jgi:hypothetical protein
VNYANDLCDPNVVHLRPMYSVTAREAGSCKHRPTANPRHLKAVILSKQFDLPRNCMLFTACIHEPVYTGIYLLTKLFNNQQPFIKSQIKRNVFENNTAQNKTLSEISILKLKVYESIQDKLIVVLF